jgi:hypothetical protein
MALVTVPIRIEFVKSGNDLVPLCCVTDLTLA